MKACGFVAPLNMVDIQRRKESLEQEIEEELYYQTDIYETSKFGGNEFFNFNITFTSRLASDRPIDYKSFIPIEDLKSKGSRHPLDRQGNQLSEIDIEFDEQGSCLATYNRDSDYKSQKITPVVKFKKGAQISNVNERLLEALITEVHDLRSQLINNQRSISQKLRNHLDKLETPFISEADVSNAMEGFDEQKESLELKIKDCDRLESLCS